MFPKRKDPVELSESHKTQLKLEGGKLANDRDWHRVRMDRINAQIEEIEKAFGEKFDVLLVEWGYR